MKRETYKKMKQLGWDRFVETMVSKNIHISQAQLPFAKHQIDTFFSIVGLTNKLERAMYKPNAKAAAPFQGLSNQLRGKK